MTAGCERLTMVADTTPESATLGDILTSVARRASDGQLLAMTLTGLIGAVVLVELLGRAGWLAAAGALAVGAYGGWAIADRSLSTLWARPGAPATVVLLLRFVRAAAVVVATLATIALAATALMPIFGGLVR